MTDQHDTYIFGNKFESPKKIEIHEIHKLKNVIKMDPSFNKKLFSNKLDFSFGLFFYFEESNLQKMAYKYDCQNFNLFYGNSKVLKILKKLQKKMGFTL